MIVSLGVPILKQAGAFGTVATTAAATHVRPNVVSAFVLRKNVVNRCSVRSQILFAVSTFPVPSFEDVMPKFLSGMFRA